jgi:aryl-alcohol dehydrogenase-like predicted oxidoreductase
MTTLHSSILSEPLIVGCWQLDDRSWKSVPETDIARAIDTYLAMGVTGFDTADIYGRSEQVLGRTLQGRDCTILTKAVFWGTVPTPMQVRHKVEASLRNLKRDYLDGIQIHWHDPNSDFAAALDAFRKLQDEGKIRMLGVTNFNTPMLERALQYVPIHTHQVQYSLIDRRVEQSMRDLCLRHNIALLPYGPLAGGFLSDRFVGLPDPKLEPDHARSFYYSNMIRKHGGWQPVSELLQTLSELAHAYQKKVSQVALNWVKQQPGVVSVISGLTLNRERIKQNVESFSWTLSPADVQRLSERSASLFEQPGDIYSYERQ